MGSFEIWLCFFAFFIFFYFSYFFVIIWGIAFF